MDQEITNLINQLHDLREDWHMIEDEHRNHLDRFDNVTREATALKVILGISWVINGIIAWLIMDTSTGETVTIEPTYFNHT
jgi:hypothetical protein|tara:strand:- start:5395 stop:5637 length:243 start_codon:yes stop_codon:yes gene_type:complete